MTRLLLIYLCLCAACVLADDEYLEECREAARMEAIWFSYQPTPQAPPPYVRRSETDPRFYVKGEVDFTGALHFVFLTKIIAPDGSEVRSELKAEEEFGRILEYFDGTYNRLRIVYTDPEAGESLPLRDMIDEVNRKTGAGMELRSALWGSFFGRQAFRHGFRSMYVDNTDGSSGHYEMVVFELRR